MNVMEYFENEAKKSRDHPNVVEKVCKATGKAALSLNIVWINSPYKVSAKEVF